MLPELYSAALKYAKMGLAIIPVCPVNHNGMSHTHREKCNTPGKMPIIREWSSAGVPTEETIHEWWGKNNKLNIGLLLGDQGKWNIVGVDIDDEIGEQYLQEWSNGYIPDTWEYTTGRGRRLLYLLPQGMKSQKFRHPTNDSKAHIDLIASGQQTVIPPSRHISGKNYTWVEGKSPADIMIANAPQWIINRIAVDYIDDKVYDYKSLSAPANENVTFSPPIKYDDWNKTLPEGERNNHLTKLAGSLLSRGNIPPEQVAFMLKAWNREHCKPPLPEIEIDKMVATIHETEQMKRAKRSVNGFTGREVLRPTPFAQAFIQQQHKQGYHWRFSAEKGLFYICDETQGPWRPLDNLYVQKLIREALIKENHLWDKNTYITEVFSALREQLVNFDAIDVFDIGQNPHTQYVFTTNGMLDWQNGKLLPWDYRTYSTLQLPVTWNPNAKELDEYKYWLDTLAQWLPEQDTIRFLQEFIGYCLIPDCSFRTAVFLYGGGANGKSLFLDVISKLFGQHITFIPLHRIAERFETIGLVDKLINICGDIDAKYLSDTGTLKALIAGDPIRAEIKHGKSFDFTPVARLMFSANQLPKVSDRSEGWYSRWKFVEFPNRFKVDPRYKRNLLNVMGSEQGLSALLYWAVEGLQRLFSQGKFTTGKAMNRSETTYRAENDSVMAFRQSCLTTVTQQGEGTMLVANTLHQVYKLWCNEVGLKAVGRIEFSKRMERLGINRQPRTINGQSCICYLGVRFSDFVMDENTYIVEEYNLLESIRRTNGGRRMANIS